VRPSGFAATSCAVGSAGRVVFVVWPLGCTTNATADADRHGGVDERVQSTGGGRVGL